MTTVTTEELEAIRELRRQRDELAEALRKLIFAVEFEGVTADQAVAIGKARAALAKLS